MKSSLPDFRVLVGECTSIGYFRDNNEDRLFVDGGRGVYIVADGMGGQAAGEQASQLAVDVISSHLHTLSRNTCDPEMVEQAITNAVMTANEAIIAQGCDDPSVQNMGTTVVLALLRASNIFIAHVGDSRAYYLHHRNLDQVTSDHNMAEALRLSGAITAEEQKTHKFRHMLWKYLGSQELNEGPDITTLSPEPGDRILLATDGLTVDPPDILREISRQPDPQQCADRLVQLALEAGSKDNVTCILLYIEPLE